MGALVEFPAHADGEHLLAYGSDEAANEVEEEVPVAKDGVGVVFGELGRKWGGVGDG